MLTQRTPNELDLQGVNQLGDMDDPMDEWWVGRGGGFGGGFGGLQCRSMPASIADKMFATNILTATDPACRLFGKTAEIFQYRLMGVTGTQSGVRRSGA